MDEQTKIITSMGIETLEKAALNNCVCKTKQCVHYNSFINGAKWQSEKNEEMFRNFIRTHHLTRIWNEWVKQYKK